MSTAFTVLSKSRWLPTIRREHALTREAIRNNLAVQFIEAPNDVRAVRDHPLQWAGEIRGVTEDRDGVLVTRRATVFPGHRNDLAARLDVTLLRRALSPRLSTNPLVSYLPWQWPASSGSSHRVFDCTDPWAHLFAHRERAVRDQMLRISQEADEIIVVSNDLADYFPGRVVRVIPNGVDEALLATPPIAPPGNSVMLYLGTLSERLDFELLGRVLSASPQWSLELVGPCSFRGFGSEPSTELLEFLRRFSGRVALHDPVSRVAAQVYIDRCDLMIAPTFRDYAVGQSSMKTFDAAARGRQVLSTSAVTAGTSTSPAQVFADDAESWSNVLRTYELTDSAMIEIRSWAEQQTWSVRFEDWISYVVLQ
jgi:glycosyltransferase involved in cell wall biosynthesis